MLRSLGVAPRTVEEMQLYCDEIDGPKMANVLAGGLTPAELALAWCRDRPYNAVVVTGTTTVQQCEEAIRAFKLEALPRELLDAIDAIHERYRSPDAALHSKEQVLREEPPASCAIV